MGKPDSERNLQINEIYKSIQGEGQLQGEPTAFVRTSGCNLRCHWCDSTYAHKNGQLLTINEIIEQVDKLNCSKICITGGEPLLQNNIQELFDVLKKQASFVYIETNGTIDITRYGNIDRFIVDYKLPSSQPKLPFYKRNLEALLANDELKFVVADRHDYEIARSVIRNYPCEAKILFSPCWGKEAFSKLADWILQDSLPVRYSLQIHKVIWGQETTR